MTNHKLKNISAGYAEVHDPAQGIYRGIVTQNNGGGKFWRAWYPCEAWTDYSGSEAVVRHVRPYQSHDFAAAKGREYIDSRAVDPATGMDTGALLFRTRNDAANFVVQNY